MFTISFVEDFTRLTKGIDPRSDKARRIENAGEFLNRVYPFMRVETTIRNGVEYNEVLVRVTPKCNQSCPFCSADPVKGEPACEVVKESLSKAHEMLNNPMITLTGGEPTVRKDLTAIIDYVLCLSNIEGVQVQTNAVVIGLKPEWFHFKTSKRLNFFVSLHAVKADVYNAMTRTKGQLPFALKGIRKLQDDGHGITINCVINKDNADHLEEYITELPNLLPRENFPELHFSIMMCPEFREKAPEYLVPYSLLAPKLEAAYHLALKQEIKISPLLNSTHAAIPACMLGACCRMREMYPEIYAHETGYEDFSKGWVKSKNCVHCKETPYCLGVPKPYASTFGLDELKPIA